MKTSRSRSQQELDERATAEARRRWISQSSSGAKASMPCSLQRRSHLVRAVAPAYRVNDIFVVHTSEDGTSFTCKAPTGVQAALVGSDRKRFFVPAYVGSKGWVGVRLDVDQDWDEIAELAAGSYRMTAPKRLVKRLDGES